jgi:hypothetical protein
LNGTVAEVSFFRAFRDAVKQTLAEQEQQQSGACVKLVAMATFSPSHLKGQWNEGAPCKKKAETETRKIVVEEVEEVCGGGRYSAGHPGPYMPGVGHV